MLFDFLKKQGNNKFYYLVDGANWSIKWDGLYITEALRKNLKLDIKVKESVIDLKNSVIHYGCRNLYLPEDYKSVDSSNKLIFTWFHGTDEDKQFIEPLPEGAKYADYIHTSCEISRRDLIRWGAPADKVVVIPLGVDLKLFSPVADKRKAALKKRLGISSDSVVIGSFQKDGNGWGEGNDPKLIKGPDVFCDAIEKIAEKYPTHVVLSGPARGYVKRRLEKAGIPFTHYYFKNFKKVAKLFHLLDIYIVASRAEGGPKAVLESMASGVPLVSTKVGMAPEVIEHGENGYLADVENVDEIISYAKKIIDNKDIQDRFIANGLETVKRYDWSVIAKEYYEKLYSKYLEK